MADEWHYARGETQAGPVSAAMLKHLALAGELTPDDLVWRTGMEEWVAARRLKGLFNAPRAPLDTATKGPDPSPVDGSDSSARESSPPKPSAAINSPLRQRPVKRPVPRPRDDIPEWEAVPVLDAAPLLEDVPCATPTAPPVFSPSAEIQSAAPQSVTDRITNEALGLGDNIKAAAALTACQMQRTKLTTITLPVALQTLGKWCFETNSYGSEFPEACQRIGTLRAEIQHIAEAAAAQPAARGFAEKTKAAARSAKDAVHAKALKHSLGQAHTALGEVVYAAHGLQSGPHDLVCPISEAQAKLATLDAEIRQLSQGKPGVVFTPQRLIIGAGIATALVLCLGIGLFSLGVGRKQNQNFTYPDGSRTSQEFFSRQEVQRENQRRDAERSLRRWGR